MFLEMKILIRINMIMEHYKRINIVMAQWFMSSGYYDLDMLWHDE